MVRDSLQMGKNSCLVGKGCILGGAGLGEKKRNSAVRPFLTRVPLPNIMVLVSNFDLETTGLLTVEWQFTQI